MKNSLTQFALSHFLLGLLWLFSANSLFAQTDLNGRPIYQAPPPFDLKIYSFRATERHNRVDVYLKFNHDMLSFIKQAEHFSARYLIVADFFDAETEKMLVEKTWAEKIVVETYEETISKKAVQAKTYTLELPLGNYTAMLRIIDQQSNQTFAVQKNIENAIDGSAKFSISSLMLIAETPRRIEERKVFSPNFSGMLFEKNETPRIYYEIYNSNRARRRVLAEYTILAVGQETEQKDRYTKILKLDSLKTEILDDIPTQQLTGGDYRLELALFDSSQAQPALVKASCAFRIRITGLAIYVPNLNEAISQLQYIADSDQIEYILAAKSDSAKIQRFNEFWKKRDPSPGTEINELMAEYYNRVNYADQHFSSYMKGWRTDMGMIYIKYGAPDFVERHPFSTSTRPYEVWEFHQHRRRFIFVDMNGFGDYRLTVPEWDPANQMR
ncbi:hypothetical protein Ctha_1867 [Chloroherpeton thalassium ATCC 35110]|uniref:GWxTD domain-containing protein n=1 Tax=Chloroherpeton thalassium (strain ATCC 35110 / GB-78) TaxID=517418 RepID=B3QTX6_CHLT3|nr:GWxTD domain-containing protein [Chloroherpeton thalassium]ACF14324.1 hypothetical protein Ctha_1867 [Chloroherpeton thalassium ATCC 35110]